MDKTAIVDVVSAVEGTSGYPHQRETTAIEVVVGSLAHIAALGNKVRFGFPLSRVRAKYGESMATLVGESASAHRSVNGWVRRVR